MLIGVIAEELLIPSALVGSSIVREAANAADIANAGFVFPLLVDDPASAIDIIDAYLGESMFETASAADIVQAGGSDYTAAIDEAATTIDSPDTLTDYIAAIGEAATTVDSPDATTVTAAVHNTWNPSDKSANIALSNGNLTATPSGASVTSVRGFVPQASKFYFEVTCSTNVTGGSGIGIASSTANLGMIWTNCLQAAFVSPSSTTGNIFVNSTTAVANLGGFAVNDIVCVAADLTNKRIWFRKNGGNWNNSGTANPATNVGGIDISVVFASVPAYPLATFAASVVLSRTANFGASAFAQTIPSGFSDARIS
jgi:SPRY domain